VIAGYAALERQVARLERDWRAIHRAESPAAMSRRTAIEIAAELGIVLDPWQRAPLLTELDALMLVTRQGGKGMVASLLALEKLLEAGTTTVIISKADRQAKRLLKRVKRLLSLLSDVPPAVVDSTYALELRNGAELLALPGSEETVRGIEAVDLLIIDEGALVPDELYQAVYPMLATTNGRCVGLTTPRGKRGWFWQEWSGGNETWHRTKITAPDIPRIDPAWLDQTRRRLGEWMYRQEFLCEFVDLEDQFFSSEIVDRAVSADVAPLIFPFAIGAAA